MEEKIKEVQERLKEQGYFSTEEIAKLVLMFEASGKKSKNNIPAMLLTGPPSAGKTFLAESFAKMIGADQKFVQCFPRMGSENFQFDIDIEQIIKKDSNNSVKEGILIQALNASKESPVVVIIDELDKSRAEVDSFLLDFLENGRVTTGTDVYTKGEYPIYTFLTSNNKRELDDSLLSRCKKHSMEKIKKELFLEITGLEDDHYLVFFYEKFPEFSIRQVKEYLNDINNLGVEFDEELLNQYINLDDMEIETVQELNDITAIAKKYNINLEVDEEKYIPNPTIIKSNFYENGNFIELSKKDEKMKRAFNK